MSSHVETAVIPVAGAGTRAFPATTALEKCLLPVYAGDRAVPVVDYMVEDCARAGVRRIVFITSQRGCDQLRDYFEVALPLRLEAQLKRLGKDEQIAQELERRRNYGLTYEYVVQPPDQYGTTYPPYLAMPHLRGERYFALAGGDDFIYHQDGASELALAIEKLAGPSVDHVIMGNPVLRDDASKYGILQIGDDGRFLGIDEKPPLERIPEQPVANISRYVLSEKIWPFIEAEMAAHRSGEHYITYPITEAANNGQVFQVHTVTGTYLDGGTPYGLLAASDFISRNPPK